MKKNLVLLSLIPILLLPSCSGEEKEGRVFSMSTGMVDKEHGNIRLASTSDVETVNPFNTVILGNLYYFDGDYTNAQLNQIKQEFSDQYNRLHALTDRHYDYLEQGKPLTNIKTINDSYGTETPILLDDYLYQLLKKSYEFSLASMGKFNLFLGQLNDIYEAKLPTTVKPKTALDCAWMESSGLRVNSFSWKQKEDIQKYVSMIPQTDEEIRKTLTFNDEEHSVIFHAYTNEAGVTNPNLSISLGGNGKGMATQYISDKLEQEYPGISLFINSGNSSLKAIGNRPDGNEWRIRYTNPAYAEFNSYPYGNSLHNPYNAAEIVYSEQGPFNLSTSGFYEQYFYEYQKTTKDFRRYSHILDPKTGYSTNTFDCVSVYLDDTGLADMYTTALMNCDSVKEAKNLFDTLNSVYQEENAQLILCERKDSTLSSPYNYQASDFKPLSPYDTPICILNTGNTYIGDYEDITNYQTLLSSTTTYEGSFQEVYYCTSGIYPNVRLLTSKEATLQQNPISVIKEIV